MIKAIIYTLVFGVIQALMLPLIGAIQRLMGMEVSQQNATNMIIAMTASSIVVLALFLYFRWAEVSRSYVQSRPWATLFWCALAAMGAIIPSQCLQELMPKLPNIVEEEFDMILRDRWGYFAIGLLAPVCEELVFRGAVLRALLRWTPRHWLAIAISALLFALIHANPIQMPHAFLIGLLLGWLYYRTDSIVPGIVYHWVNNSIAYVVYNFYPDPQMELIDLFGSQRTVAAAVLFSLLILLPALYQLNLRLRKAK
ncbi:MAG: CPBP family intramembrane metalloprotease [Prevotella sp.]|nr:CPBP family intramembrane metalloprotease [Prevotella sp.]